MFRRTAQCALLACLVALAAAHARALETTSPAPSTGGKGFIWRIERYGATGWLVGSIHTLTPDYYPLPDAMERAFMRSATVMEEVDQRELASPEVRALVQNKGFYQDDRSLE